RSADASPPVLLFTEYLGGTADVIGFSRGLVKNARARRAIRPRANGGGCGMRRSMGMGTDLPGWRARLRLSSALVLLAFVICHLSGHSLLLVGQSVAEEGLAALMRPWRSVPGTVLLVTAFLVHYVNALWSIYERRSLSLRGWEWAQLLLGLCIPAL